jgi:hypothetical protein
MTYKDLRDLCRYYFYPSLYSPFFSSPATFTSFLILEHAKHTSLQVLCVDDFFYLAAVPADTDLSCLCSNVPSSGKPVLTTLTIPLIEPGSIQC